jgi:uncharacterized protein (TIGR02597 family)
LGRKRHKERGLFAIYLPVNIPQIHFSAAVAAILCLGGLPADLALSQTETAVTSPVGYLQEQCLGSSDTLLAIPFTRPVAFVGSVTSITGNSLTLNNGSFTAGTYVYNPTGSPAVTDNFYLSIGPLPVALSGTLSVTENSATVTGSGTAFGTQVLVGDRLSINDGYNQISFTVTAVASPTSLTIDRLFLDAAAGSTGATLPNLAATYDHSPYEGRWYMITANGTNTVTVNLNGDTLASVAAGTEVSIIPFWSLNTLFPVANVGTSFTPSTSTNILNTLILIPSYTTAGINIPAATIYYYLSIADNTGWRSYSDSITTDHGNDYLLPDGYFTVRQGNSSPTVNLPFNGAVPMNKLVTSLTTSSTRTHDNPVGLNRPVGVALSSLGLGASDGSFQTTTSSNYIQDELLLYNNASVTINKPASIIYYYVNDLVNNVPNIGWRSYADSVTAPHDSDIIPAASALTIRKAVTGNGQTVDWNNNPNF